MRQVGEREGEERGVRGGQRMSLRWRGRLGEGKRQIAEREKREGEDPKEKGTYSRGFRRRARIPSILTYYTIRHQLHSHLHSSGTRPTRVHPPIFLISSRSECILSY